MKLHHIGIVMKNGRLKGRFLSVLPMKKNGDGFVEKYGAMCEMYLLSGGVKIELIFPQEGSPLEKFNNGQGGIHHLAFEVPGRLEDAMNDLRARCDAVFLDRDPVNGIAGMMVAFLPPINTGGVTIELVQGDQAEA